MIESTIPELAGKVRAFKSIQQQGAVDRVAQAKERLRLMGAEINEAYFVPD